MPQLHTVRITSASDVSLPTTGLYLTAIQVEGGSTAGALEIQFDGQASAAFPCPANGNHRYALNEAYPQGGTIKAANLTFTGGLAAATFVFSNAKGSGGPLSAHRAMTNTHTFAGSGSSTQTITWDIGNQSPSGIVLMCETSAVRAAFPTVGPYTDTVEGSNRSFLPPVHDAPDLPASNSLDLTVTADGALTSVAVVYY